MLKNNRYGKLVNLLTMGVLVSFSQTAVAGGFQLTEQNATNLGTAYAGNGSLAEDASTGYYNAAGLTRLGQEQIALSGVWIHSTSKLTATKAVTTRGQSGFVATSPNKANRSDSLIPALHYAKRLDEAWVLSLNITSPFGLKNNYRNDSVTRYMATRSELDTINIGPSVAYGFNNGLSLGAGVDALYLTAKLDSRLGAQPIPATDGYIENKASGWGYGVHLGGLYEFSDATRIGVSYRSKVKVKAEGSSLLDLSGRNGVYQGVKATVTLPESLNLSFYHDLNQQWAVVADAQWTRWKRFNQLALQFQDGTQQITPENFKSRIKLAAGVIHQLNDAWKLKVGTAFDRTPVQEANRTVRIPDANRIWAAVGAQYRITKKASIDFGYAHIFFKKANVNEAAAQALGTPRLGNSIQGTSKTKADLIGIQLTWDLV